MPDMIYEKFPDDHYAIFTMNRPERLNALGGQMMREQSEALEDFTLDADMRVGIMTGTGRAFSAGADLKDMAERNAKNADIEARFAEGNITEEQRDAELKANMRGGGGMESTFAFTKNPKPFIAAVNGLAFGGGMERSMECDIRIASTQATFALPEVKRGIMAGYAIHHFSRLVPFGEVMYFLMTGEPIDAQEARRIGFIHEVVEPDRLIPRAVELAKTIAANAPLAVQGSKAVAHYWRQFNIQESSRLSDWVYRTINGSEDAKEGPKAFTEKRAPVWKGQ